MEGMNVSVIVPVLNEREVIVKLVGALLTQTRTPGELVIADGGSTDGTRQLLDRLAESDVRIRVVDGPGGIAENRNAAIAAARGEIIACTDVGCLPRPDWLDRITAPFEEGADWVAGVSRPVGDDLLSAAAGFVLMPAVDEVNPRYFIPGGASQAFKKETWQQVGGFPEGLAAAEDTLFGQRMRAAGYRPVFQPTAVVRWQAPPRLLAVLRKAWLWGSSDAAAGVSSGVYARVLLAYWGPVIAAAVTLATPWRWLSPLLVLPLGWLAVRRTHRKWAWIDHPWAPLLLGVGHVAKMWAQSAGWVGGYLRKPDRPRLRSLARRQLQRSVVAAKRLVRPLVPEPVMLRMRYASPDQGSRVNVDVVVSSPAEAAAWVRATPATYRARTLDSFPAQEEPAVELIGDCSAPSRGELLRPLADPEVAVSVLAEAKPPRIDRSRVAEPQVAALAVAVRPEVAAEVAAPDAGTAWDRARQAGLRIALIPRRPTGEPVGRRHPIEQPGSVVVLGTVPMHDVGGGSRAAQMAHELAGRGYHVQHLHYFEADESVDLGLRFVHPLLEQGRFQDFDPDVFLPRVRSRHRLAIVELPHPQFLPLIIRLKEAGYRVVYDLMDDWSDPALGGWGYSRSVEEAMVRAADGLVASANALGEYLEQLAGRPVTLVPNAVNTRIFRPGDYLPPQDLPSGEGPVLEYHGSLYGDWFDWEALTKVAEAFPQARVVVIGDLRRSPPVPGNVHFLGLKPQHRLPAYLAQTRVGLVPFVVSPTTHTVSPLKVFECLAMGVPVAAPPLQPLEGLEGVYVDPDLVTAVATALDAPRPDPAQAASQHGWGERMGRLLGSVGLTLADDDAGAIQIRERPVTRWPKEHRSS